MKREIRFRTWHVDGFSYFTIGQMFTNEAKRKYDMDCLNGVYFEQYTGLKDKNGVEIYEGDIINVFNWGVKTKDHLLNTAVVKWDIDEHGWSWIDSSGRYSCTNDYNIDNYDRWRNILVIGNIHENKELLKKNAS